MNPAPPVTMIVISNNLLFVHPNRSIPPPSPVGKPGPSQVHHGRFFLPPDGRLNTEKENGILFLENAERRFL